MYHFEKEKKITLQYCQLPFLPFHTHTQTKKHFFFLFFTLYLLFFIDIIFIFMKCSLSVKSLHYKRNILLYGGERGCFVWDFWCR